MEIRRTWTFRKHFAYQQIDLIAMREKHCGYSLWLCCHQSEGTSTCWWLGCNSCQAVMALYASRLNQLSCTLCPSVSWINPPLFQLYSEFSFKNLSICSMKHLVFMADISAAESFLCDFFTLAGPYPTCPRLASPYPALLQPRWKTESRRAPEHLLFPSQAPYRTQNNFEVTEEWTSLPKITAFSNMWGLRAPC